jgi:predicted nucleotidyltransferase
MASEPGSVTDIEAAREYHRELAERRFAEREAARAEWLERARGAIRRLAPDYPEIERVYLFGSLVQPGRFGPRSDLDVAVICESPRAESSFWSALERELRRDVDVRPLKDALVDVVQLTGELVYER